MRRMSLAAAALTIVVGACGGSGATTGPTAGAATSATTVPTATALVTPSQPATPSPTPSAAPSLSPGAIRYRVVNLSEAVVDVHVRTQGIVTAFPVATGVVPGTVTGDFFPPEPGGVVVVRTGDMDPTCVVDCTFLAESSTGFGDGDQRTIVVREDGATEFWEHPEATSIGKMANAIGPADPARADMFVVAQGVSGADFGLQLAYVGAPGCQVNYDAPDILIGGTQVVRFALEPAGVEATLHGNNDRDCSGAAVGGPFRVAGAPGSRTFLFLWGAVDAMKGLIVPIP